MALSRTRKNNLNSEAKRRFTYDRENHLSNANKVLGDGLNSYKTSNANPKQRKALQEVENQVAPSSKNLKSSAKNIKETVESYAELKKIVKQIKEDQLDCLDIIIKNGEDPLKYEEYIDDVFDYFKHIERRAIIKSKTYSNQPLITEKMRSILVDWIIQIHDHYKLQPESLFLCIQILDRYLDINTITREDFQLLGATCLLLGTKYYEQVVLETKDLQYMTNGACSVSQICVMECTVLNALEFDLSPPVSWCFIRHYTSVLNCSSKCIRMAEYLLESSLLDSFMSSVTPSSVAVASIYLANYALDEFEWDDNKCERYSGYTSTGVLPVVRRIAHIILKNDRSGLKFISKKYSQESAEYVSSHEFFTSSSFINFGTINGF